MTVVCYVTNCPYYDSGFCAKQVIKIDEQGMCNVIWKKGSPRSLQKPFTQQNYPRKKIEIENAEYYEIDDEENEILGEQENINEPSGETENVQKESST